MRHSTTHGGSIGFVFASLGLLMAVTACSSEGNGDSGSRSATFEQLLKTAPAPVPPDSGSCTAVHVGDGVTCQSPAEWKQLLSSGDWSRPDLCNAPGLYLYDAAFSADCADGGSTFATVTCCADPKGPPPADPDANDRFCTSGALGDGSLCKTPDEWTAEITALCDVKALLVTDIALLENGEECPGGGSAYAKFQCCSDSVAVPPPAPPPDPDTCISVTLPGDCGTKDAFLEQAHTECSVSGRVVKAFTATETCGDGGIFTATFQCCLSN